MVRAEDDQWSQCFEAGKNSLMADDLTNAEHSFRRALGVAESSGALDERVIQSLNCLALTYFRRDDHQFAEVTYARALACADQVYGPESPKVLVSLNGLAFFMLHTKRFAKAEPLYIRALEITEKLRGMRHLEVAAVNKNLALVYEKLNQQAKAKEYYQRALDIFDAVAPTHPDRDQVRNSLKKVTAMSAQQQSMQDTGQVKKQPPHNTSQNVPKRPNADDYVIRSTPSAGASPSHSIDDGITDEPIGVAPAPEAMPTPKLTPSNIKPEDDKSVVAGGPPGKKSLWDNIKDLVSPGKKVSDETSRPAQARNQQTPTPSPPQAPPKPTTATTSAPNKPSSQPASPAIGTPAMAASAEQKRPPDQKRSSPEISTASSKGVEPHPQAVSQSQKPTEEFPRWMKQAALNPDAERKSPSTSQQNQSDQQGSDQTISGVNAKATSNAADPLAQSWQKLKLGNLFGGGKRSGATEPDPKISGAKQQSDDLETTGPRGVHKDSREKLIGTKIDNRYLVDSFIGAGGMSVVYKATHVMMDRTVAIKMMHSDLAQKDSFLKRFQQEARTASVLAHPNIVSLHDFGITSDGLLYIVMDYVEGIALDEVIGAGQIPAERAVSILAQACDGLAHAHEKGILHRDLKPSNLMLIKGDREEVKVVDFGLAKSMSGLETSNMKLTRTGEFVGSPLYMSPEQFRVKQLDARSDIYSLGCVAYEAVTGKTAFNGETFGEILAKHMAEDPPSFDEACPERKLSKALEKAIFKALQKKPDDRYSTMLEFKEKLQEAIAQK